MPLPVLLALVSLAPAQLQDLWNPTESPSGRLLAWVDAGSPTQLLRVSRPDPRGPSLVVSGASQPLTDLRRDNPHRFVAGGRLVFQADRLVDQRFELWSVGADLIPVRLSNGGNVQRFETDPGRARVLFSEGTSLFARAVDGVGVPITLGPADALGIVAWEVTPDGQRVAYVSKHSPLRYRLWIQPLDGSLAPLLLVDDLLISLYSGIEDEESITRLTFTPDGAFVFFGELTGPFAPERFLSVVRTDGSAADVRLPYGTLAPEQTSVLHFGPELRIFETDVNGRTRLLAGSRARQLEPLQPGQPRLLLSNDGRHLLTVAELQDDEYSIFSAPRSGAPDLDRLAALPQGGAPLLVATIDGELLFRHTQRFGAPTLYRVPLDGTAAPLPLGTITRAAFFSQKVLVQGPDCFFFGTLAGHPSEGLWHVDMGGSRPPTLLTIQPIDPLLLCAGILVGVDRSGVAEELFGLPLDGSFAPERYD